MLLVRVVTGGQAGADQAGWAAAKAAGLETGGWMPAGFLTEAGPRPEFAELYGAREIPDGDYATRTIRNARDSDATIWFGRSDSSGGKLTLAACVALERPFFVVQDGISKPSYVAAWLREKGVRVLNVAGNRASRDGELGPRVDRFLQVLFRKTLRII